MGDAQLRGWKQIAAFLGTSPRTAQRWEAEFSLPVHRLGSGRRASVFAHREELAAWLESSAAPAAAGGAEDSAPRPAPEGEDAAPAPAPAEEEGAAPGLATGEDAEAPLALASVADKAVVSGPVVGEAAGPANYRVRKVRRSWRTLSVAAAAVSVVLVLGVSLALALRHPAPIARAGVPQASETVPLIQLRVTSPDGFRSSMLIRDGGSASMSWDGRELRLSARLIDDMVDLSVADVSDAGPPAAHAPVQVGAMRLRRGVVATLKMSVPFTIEWVDVRRPDGRRAGHQ